MTDWKSKRKKKWLNMIKKKCSAVVAYIVATAVVHTAFAVPAEFIFRMKQVLHTVDNTLVFKSEAHPY